MASRPDLKCWMCLQVLLLRQRHVRADHGGPGRTIAVQRPLAAGAGPYAGPVRERVHRTQCLDDVPGAGRRTPGATRERRRFLPCCMIIHCLATNPSPNAPQSSPIPGLTRPRRHLYADEVVQASIDNHDAFCCQAVPTLAWCLPVGHGAERAPAAAQLQAAAQGGRQRNAPGVLCAWHPRVIPGLLLTSCNGCANSALIQDGPAACLQTSGLPQT